MINQVGAEARVDAQAGTPQAHETIGRLRGATPVGPGEGTPAVTPFSKFDVLRLVIKTALPAFSIRDAWWSRSVNAAINKSLRATTPEQLGGALNDIQRLPHSQQFVPIVIFGQQFRSLDVFHDDAFANVKQRFLAALQELGPAGQRAMVQIATTYEAFVLMRTVGDASDHAGFAADRNETFEQWRGLFGFSAVMGAAFVVNEYGPPLANAARTWLNDWLSGPATGPRQA